MTQLDYRMMVKEAAHAAVDSVQYWDNNPGGNSSWIWSHEYSLRDKEGTLFFSDRFESCWLIAPSGSRKFRELWELREFLKG